jgi:hypothetical protein
MGLLVVHSYRLFDGQLAYRKRLRRRSTPRTSKPTKSLAVRRRDSPKSARGAGHRRVRQVPANCTALRGVGYTLVTTGLPLNCLIKAAHLLSHSAGGASQTRRGFYSAPHYAKYFSARKGRKRSGRLSPRTYAPRGAFPRHRARHGETRTRSLHILFEERPGAELFHEKLERFGGIVGHSIHGYGDFILVQPVDQTARVD